MPAWLRTEHVENWLTWLAVLTGAGALLLIIVGPIVRGEPLSDTAIATAVYLMIASAPVCLIVNVYALVGIASELRKQQAILEREIAELEQA